MSGINSKLALAEENIRKLYKQQQKLSKMKYGEQKRTEEENEQSIHEL